jgi:hypothetical protein
MRYSYLHDPVQAQNLHCRAVTSTIEYNWFDRAKSYVGDLMTSDDYANNPQGSLTQTMVLRGNVIIEAATQANTSQIFAVYNDEASGHPVSFSVTALYNTVIGAGAHAAFLHLSNADGTSMAAVVDDNIISGTSQPEFDEDSTHATVTGTHNWLQTGATLTGLPGITGSVFGSTPGFVDAATMDFDLAPGSACIGAADSTVSGLPTAEYYENETVTRMVRARATARDIGAFEHTTTGPASGPYGSDGGAAPVPDASAMPDATAPGELDASYDDAPASGGSMTSGAGCGCRVDGGDRARSFGGPGLLLLASALAITSRRSRRCRRNERAGP